MAARDLGVARPLVDDEVPNGVRVPFARLSSHKSQPLTCTVMTASSLAGMSVLLVAHTRSDEDGWEVMRLSCTRWRPRGPWTSISSFAGLNCSTYAAMKSPPRRAFSWMSPSKTYMGTSTVPNKMTMTKTGTDNLQLVAKIPATHNCNSAKFGSKDEANG
ncbi:hypothetical protein FOCC_FOCC016135 [Frankliniella occidentalis]|nr:hypothetical protein FOCC_FOCC016135 [Frankliniella occidentalis]